MASYSTTVTLAAPAAGNVLLPNGSTVVTISLDVTAQAAVAAALAAQMGSYVAQAAPGGTPDGYVLTSTGGVYAPAAPTGGGSGGGYSDDTDGTTVSG